MVTTGVNVHVRNWIYASASQTCTRPSRFNSLNSLLPQNAHDDFPASETMISLSRRCGGGPIFCHKTQTNAQRLEEAVFIPITGAAGGFSFDGTAADLAYFTASGPTWRGVKLYLQTPTAFSPAPHYRTRLFACCLAGFMAQGLGYLLQSVPFPARKTPRQCTQCAKKPSNGKYSSRFEKMNISFNVLFVFVK